MRPMSSRYVLEHDAFKGHITSSTVVSGPIFDQLAQYHRIIGVESYASADGCGWRMCKVKDPVSGEMIEGFQILSFLATPDQQRIQHHKTGRLYDIDVRLD